MSVQPGVNYNFHNLNSRKDWAVYGNSPVSGTSLVQYDSNAGANQAFQFVNVPGIPSTYYIVTDPAFGNFYVSVDLNSDFGNNSGLNIYSDAEYPRGNNPYSQWRIYNTVQPQVIMANVETGLFVDVINDSIDDNAYLVIFEGNGRLDQLWYLIPWA